MTLKPCPFCGGSPVMENETINGVSWSTVRCTGCGANSGPSSAELSTVRWNSRVPADETASELETPAGGKP